jgi:hypothetical protein
MPDVKDLNDGKEWSDVDIEDLRRALEHGTSIEDAAQFLHRATAIAEVAHKALELGLKTAAGPD